MDNPPPVQRPYGQSHGGGVYLAFFDMWPENFEFLWDFEELWEHPIMKKRAYPRRVHFRSRNRITSPGKKIADPKLFDQFVISGKFPKSPKFPKIPKKAPKNRKLPQIFRKK